jgi:hypothetical protein
LKKRLDGLEDTPRIGRKTQYDQEVVAELISMTFETPEHGSQWPTKEMAKEVAMSHMPVHRIWKRNDLKFHLLKTFNYQQ